MDLYLLNVHKYVAGYLPGSNLGMNILLQIARSKGYSAEMYQENVSKVKELIDRLIESDDLPKVVGFYTDFNNITWTTKVIRRLKNKAASIKVVVGGPQSVGLGREFLEESGADVLCPGEGEISLMEILAYFVRGEGKLSDIQGVGFIEDGEYISTPQRKGIEDLDSIPWPDLSLAPEYTKYIMPILTGRGCPMACTFCYEGANSRNVRFASPEAVIKEIKKRAESDKTLRYINFLDDTWTLNRQRVETMCDALAELRQTYDFVWFASAHINTILTQPGLVRKMTDSGMRKIFFGIESGNDGVLKKFNKHITRQAIIDGITRCMEEGAPAIAGNFIIGGPYETPQTADDSVSLSEHLMDIAPGRFETSFFTFLPYPNTPMTNDPDRFGIKIYNEYIDCCLEDIPLSSTEELSYEDMFKLRVDLNMRLQKRMKQMYIDGRIPESSILETYRMYYNYGIYSRWMEYVYSHNPTHDLYWKMRAREGLKTSGEIAEAGGNLEEAFVAKTVMVWDCYDTHAHKLDGFDVDETDITIITYCNSKLRLGEVLARLEGKGIERSTVMNRLAEYEKRRWILYLPM